MQIKYVLNAPVRQPSLLRKLLGLVVMVAVLGLVLMFSAVLLVGLLIVGSVAWAWLWWKTRGLRKHLRTFQEQAEVQARHRAESASNDAVFEGEVIRVVDPKTEK